MRLILMSMLLTLLLPGCSEVPEPPLRLGISAWLGNDPFILARDLDILKAPTVRVVELSSIAETKRNLRNGELEAAALTLDEALRLVEEGVALQIVGVLSLSDGADAIVAGSSIRTLQDLRGKRLALEDGAVGMLLMRRMLMVGGYSLSDLHLQYMEAPLHEQVLRSGQVDAVITYEPMRSRLLADGYNELFSSGWMPGELVDVLVVRNDLSPRRRQSLVDLLVGWERGLEYLNKHTDEAVELLVRGSELTQQEYLTAFNGIYFHNIRDSVSLLQGAEPGLAQGSRLLVNILIEQQMLAEMPDWSLLLNAQYARQAQLRREGQP
ncbi:ABC transporter substrate-binding protein [Nitrincola sp. MINF-07-Sa-05]|uniref:ABC transporter substrate-binding protein n=1 Tax=Nitrincola salilacus TaxID=3400273 RepID=UPI003917F750